ncbi:MAG: tetratricopeptide repeat protein [Candidatus Hodarchaeales archaeon]
MPIPFITDFFTRTKIKLKSILHTQELKQVEQVIQDGNLDEALIIIENLEKKEDLVETIRIKSQILKSSVFTQKEDHEKGLELAVLALNDSKNLEKPLLIVDATISKADALFGLGKVNDCLDTVLECENLLKTLDHINLVDLEEKEASLNRIKGIVYRKKGDLNLALECLLESLSVRQKHRDLLEVADCFNKIGIIHASKGEFDLALDYLLQSLETYEKLGNERPTIKLFNNIGLIYAYKGDPDQALEYYHKSLELSEKYKYEQSAATLLLNIGLIYIDKGELNLALDYNQRSLERYEELENKYEIAICLNNIGMIYDNKGDIDKALDFYTRSLSLFEELENKHKIAMSFNNIGKCYEFRGDVDKATSYFEKSLEVFEEIGNNLETSETLRNLIEISAHSGSVENAQPYLLKLQEITDKDKNKIIDQIYRFSKAIILKTSDRVVQKAEAQRFFQEIAEEDIIRHSTTVVAIVNLCELFLQELRTSGNEEVLNEIKALVQQLLTIAENQHSYFLFANTYRLKSRMALFELDLTLARQLLIQAQQIAEEKGLQQIAMMISGEHDTLLNQLSKWNDLIDSNVPLIERLEMAELEGMVTQMVRKKADIPEIPEEDPSLFLILSRSGTISYSKQFISEKILDDQVVGDLLTAINSFIQETFSADGSIERVKHKDHTLLLKPLESLHCCYVFKGQSYSALQKLEKFIEAAKASDIVWNVLTRSGISDQQLSKEAAIEDLVTEVFLSPHYQIVLSDT